MFANLSVKIEEGGNLFAEILKHFGNLEPKLTRLKEIEHEADIITHNIYKKMHKTFVTPLDREDIYSLASKMDSVLDMTEAAVVRMYLYKVKMLVPEIIELAEILNNSIAEIKKAIHLMKNIKKNIARSKRPSLESTPSRMRPTMSCVNLWRGFLTREKIPSS